MTQEPLFSLDPDPPAVSDAGAVPEWVRAAAADLNPAGRSSFAALLDCPRCGSPVFRGPDVQYGLAGDLTADPVVLTPADELAVLLAGRALVEVEARRTGVLLFTRDQWLVRKPAGTRGRFAAPGHKCFSDPVGFPVPWVLIYEPPPNHERSNHECPF